MHDASYIARLRALCDRYGVHLIADEIAVGCGRTGTFFASEQAGVWPDFLCLSKGISGGYLPLSIVLSRDEIFAAFYDDDTTRGFLHSHSYTGNPLACRAALATLDLFASDDVLARNAAKSATLRAALEPLAKHPRGAQPAPMRNDLRVRCRDRRSADHESVLAPLLPPCNATRTVAAADRQYGLSDAAVHSRRRRTRMARRAYGRNVRRHRRGGTLMQLLDTLEQGLEELDARGLRRRRRIADTPCAAHMTVDGRETIGFASNDYLGLAAHPLLIAAMAEGRTALWGRQRRLASARRAFARACATRRRPCRVRGRLQRRAARAVLQHRLYGESRDADGARGPAARRCSRMR